MGQDFHNYQGITLKDSIDKHLQRREIKQALIELRKLVAQYPQDGRSDCFHSIESSYNCLVNYFLSGGDDPIRDTIIDQLAIEAYKLLDEIINEENLASYPRKSLLSHLQEQHTNIFGHERDAFYHFLLMRDASALRQEWDELHSTGNSISLQMAATALTLNVLSAFSEELLSLLLDMTNDADSIVSDKALVGCILAIRRYDARIPLYLEATKRWRDITDQPKMRERVSQICLVLLATTLTNQVSDAMKNLQDDIIAQQKNLKQGQTSIFLNLNDLEEGNPAWSKEMNKMVSKHSEAIMHLHQMGADINYTAAKIALGHGFFQSEITNWFIPFSKDNPEIGIDFNSPAGKLVLKLLYANEATCSIDLYSTCIALKRTGFDMLTDMLPDEIKEMSDAEINLHREKNQPESIITLYIRNLFRFFNLNPWEYANEMKGIASICRTKMLQPCFDEYWEIIADHCLELKLYEEAEYILSGKKLPPSIQLWQKLGYAQQKQDRYVQAIKSFEKVLALQDDDEWTLHHLATCAMKDDKYKTAIKYYDTLLELKPDNTKYIYQKAICLERLEQYNDALQLFCKLDLLEPDTIKYQRGIAWCALMQKKVSMALSYAEKVANSTEAKLYDYVNYGHCLLVDKQRAKAVEYYRKGEIFDSKVGSSISTYIDFEKDTRSLIKQGLISGRDFKLICDYLCTEESQE